MKEKESINMAAHRKVSAEMSMVIALVRFPLPLAVMAVHFFSKVPFVVKGVEYAPASNPLTSCFIDFVKIFVADFSVPVFFFVSGFLFFASGFGRDIFIKKLKRRARSLLLPYILWNIIAVVAVWMLYLPAFNSLLPSLIGKHYEMTLPDFLQGFVAIGPDAVPHDGNLWFVRELMTVILLSPVIFWGLKKAGVWLLGLLGVVWGICFVSVAPNYLQFLSGAMFFYSLGSWFSIAQRDPLALFLRLAKVAVILFILFGVVQWIIGTEHQTLCRFFKIITVPSALTIVVSAAYKWGNSNLRKRLFGNVALSNVIPGIAFFIFAGHAFVFWRFKILVFALFRPVSDLGMLATYLLGYLLLFLLLTGVYWIISKLFPLPARILSGRF